ncbi:MFS transporter [Devosia yakushimensis]|uniref:MFS transporter n=1 Tax=Devosia yakushimensis TaxID=470028 RepID=UPI0024E0FE89|nr:MFS transporter [Devosia yakushimensis]
MSSQTFRLLVILAIGQVIGWGTVSLLAVMGADLATALNLPLPTIFAGNSAFYVASGLCGPLLAPFFVRLGARTLMVVGSLVAAAGFVILASSTNPIVYFAAWLVLGAAGAASLSTAAYIALNEGAGTDTKTAIGILMLITGVSSAIFWPTTAWLQGILGWRTTCLVFGAMVLSCAALYRFGLPASANARHEAAAAPAEAASLRSRTFYLLAAAIALNAFVTYGFSAILIELLRRLGLPEQDVIFMASMLGVVQVFARALDFLGGGRWDGLTTALLAGMGVPLAMLVLLAGGATWQAVAAFILIYGISSGALAVSRATMPLVFFKKHDYARAASTIALPLNLLAAAAPPVLVGLLDGFGTTTLLLTAAACSTVAFSLLIALQRRRPKPDQAGLRLDQ